LASHRTPDILELLRERGRDAMSFLALESGMRHWFDAPPPEGTGSCVAYADTAGAWVAACGPLVAETGGEHGADAAAARFVAAARAAGKRACFFATEQPHLDGMSHLLIGEQPVFHPREWLERLHERKRLREQLRRARAKGVRVRRASPEGLAPGSPLQTQVEGLARAWLGSRHIEPMGFLVAVEPFHHPEEHRYLVAEQAGRVVAFLSAVPIYARRAWLVEDLFRAADAPNGTTETLLHALLCDVGQDERVILGLTPLSGPVAWPLRAARRLSRPLFDFAGLRAFRNRMRAEAWERVWLVYPRGQPAWLTVLDSLRAFANGSLLRFAFASFVRHPSGLPWMLAFPLAPWTLVLAWLAVTGRSRLLGFHHAELLLWVAFDALLLLLLVRAAMRPRLSRMLLATGLAGVDATLSVGHIVFAGFGVTAAALLLRTMATGAPLLGTLLLAWSSSRTR